MKTASLLVLTLCSSLVAKTQTNLSIGNEPLLTKKEAQLLDSLLQTQRGNFTFSNKKVVFVTGNVGTTLRAKSEFFRENVLPCLVPGSTSRLSFVPLTAAEKSKAGDYDAIVFPSPIKAVFKTQLLKQLRATNVKSK
jgi:hypothetical protein